MLYKNRIVEGRKSQIGVTIYHRPRGFCLHQSAT